MKRSYSRRELYALGEPLGDSATYRKAGGLVLGDGGGGGGGAPATPDKTTQTMELPEWARPYAQSTLAKGAALTDINQNPYQQYGGNRIAGFSPMQMQSFQGAANMDAGPRGFQKNVGGYMSPYMQNVVDVEKRGAIRDYQVGNTMQQAQATQAGAFGGGREAIQRAERERGLMGTLGGIQARGSQAAFDQASNQFRQGIQQGVAVNQLQNQYGGQMQQQALRPLDMAYQDFQTQQNYPYKQLGFMSDLVRGMPLGQKSTNTMYEQGPGMVQTLAGLGGAAYGFGKSGLFGKEGGLMSSYADGGEITDGEPVVRYESGGVTSQQNVEGILNKLSDQQLQQAKESALNRRDLEQAQMVDAEMAERASIRGGLGGAFNQLPLEQQETMMAGGGIVAFAGGGTYGKRFEQSLTDLKAMANKAPVEPTPEQRDEAISTRIPMLEKRYGPDITQPYLEETKAKREKLPEQMEKDQGLAIAMASLGLLARKKRPGEGKNQQLIAGLGEAGLQFAGEVGKLKKESREADDKLRQSEILLATAQQSRKEGLINKADAEETRAQDLKRDGFKTNLGVQEKITQLENGLAGTEMQGENALKVANVNVAGQLAAAKLNKEAGATADRQIAALAADLKRQYPNMSPAEINARATKEFLNLSGRYPSTDRAADARAASYEKISGSVDDRLVTDRKYRELQKADKKTGGTTADQYRDQLIAVAMEKARSDNAGAQGQPAPAAQQQQATPVKVTSQEQFAKLPSGTTFVAPDGSVRIKP